MLNLSHYEIKEKISEGLHSCVYRGHRISDNLPVILKRLKNDYPSPEESARFVREYEITRSLELDDVIDAYELVQDHNSFVIVLKDFGGESLAKLLSERKLDLESFLRLSIKITSALAEVHQRRIIHKDINPSNIVWNPETGQVKIIDFGIATELSRETPYAVNPNVMEGTLPYMSPEQTGRMNRGLDYRTDLYSLGATFYKLLAGQSPFSSKDQMELVHSHIAAQPVSPQAIDSTIPAVVSALILKLLEKTAEERYQSASGVQYDLGKCLSLLQKGKDTILSDSKSSFPPTSNIPIIPEFALGEKDISDQFEIPQKLYGREKDINQLLKVFENASQGDTEMMLVSGFSGVGKSALVHEVHKPIVEKKGYFISGKFDQFQRDIPYSSLIQAFRNLVRQILTEETENIERWKKELLLALRL